MSDTPTIDFLKSVAHNPEVRLELRLTAAGYVVPFEAHRKASKPYVPVIPKGYQLLSDLKTVAACQAALQQIILDVISGVLTLDAAKYLYEFIPPLNNSLEVSEIREQIQLFKEFVKRVEDQGLLPVNSIEGTVVEPERDAEGAS